MKEGSKTGGRVIRRNTVKDPRHAASDGVQKTDRWRDGGEQGDRNR